MSNPPKWRLNRAVRVVPMTPPHQAELKGWLTSPDLEGKDRLQALVDGFPAWDPGEANVAITHGGQLEGGALIRHEYLQNIWVRSQGQGIGRSATYFILRYLAKGHQRALVNDPNPRMQKVLNRISFWDWWNGAFARVVRFIPPEP